MKLNNSVKIIFFNILAVIALCLLLEVGARGYVYYLKGTSTAGLAMRTMYLDYAPFVMFGSGFKKTTDKYLENIKDSDNKLYKILLLGASTAGGFDEEIIENALKKRFPKRDFKVLKLALGGYNVRQELIVLSLWGMKVKPDLIITFDGANDLIHRLREKRAGVFYLDETYKLMLQNAFLSPVMEIIRYSQFRNGIVRFFARKREYKFEDYKDAIDVFIEAQKSINIFAKGMGSKRVMILQPYNQFKNPLTVNELAHTLYNYRKDVVMKLYNALAIKMKELALTDQIPFLDGRFVYEGMNEDIFSDDVHFRDTRGYEVLAKRIADIVVEKGL